MEPTPVAIFVRVSSKKRQDYERQVRDLQQHADRQGYRVVEVLTERISATKKRLAQRPEFDRLMELAKGGAIRKVLATEMTRLGRRTAENVQILEQLLALGVSVYAQSIGLETLLPNGKRNPVAMIIMLVMSEIGQNETELLAERIISGQEYARSQGKHIGRPAGSGKQAAQLLLQYPKVVQKLKDGGYSIREIGKICGCSPATVQKVKAAVERLAASAG